MANTTTLLRFEEKTEWGNLFRDIRTGEGVYVKSYEDGTLVIDPILGRTIQDTAQFVEGCFGEGSNADSVLSDTYETDTSLNQIGFTFNEVEIVASATTTAEEIVKQLYDGYEVQEAKRKAEYEEYKKTPQYAIDMAEQARKEAERKVITDEVLHIDETTEMEFVDDEAKVKWDEFVEVNSKDGYSKGVVDYARRWAKYMQRKIANGEQLIDIADTTSHGADIEGITGFMYGCAVNTLSHLWKHGEDLRKWHNKSYGHDGDGVVNPAILTVSVGE